MLSSRIFSPLDSFARAATADYFHFLAPAMIVRMPPHRADIRTHIFVIFYKPPGYFSTARDFCQFCDAAAVSSRRRVRLRIRHDHTAPSTPYLRRFSSRRDGVISYAHFVVAGAS